MALIKCPECNKEVSDRASQCPNCGYPINDQNVVVQDEIILMQGVCNRIKSKFFVQNGNALLTNKRFIYSKHSLAKIATIGVLSNLTRGSYEFEIPINDIVSIEDSRHGVSKTLTVNVKNEEPYKFYFSKLEEWKIHFNNLIMKK